MWVSNLIFFSFLFSFFFFFVDYAFKNIQKLLNAKAQTYYIQTSPTTVTKMNPMNGKTAWQMM